ncbi:IclR family transcriptional regulator [Brevibacillus nitrificans]|uniref:IclR family transcriptional regulator n=1 Tax=Brevibacillus nitrificans TaxID=651560 RepID=A0A3M8DBG5_9BACL|nr:IclR family transcriptional regulator [Brevibacillus nitrificans]RNB85374.1 IclR family transcriptional regulator [Brevibacillus nitrificans]
MEEPDLSRRVQSIEVGFAILRAIAEKKGAMSLSELAEATKLFKSQLYRYLNSFVHLGVLIRTEDENPKWSLGHELIMLGSATLESMDLTKQATPYLMNLRDQLNETVALSIWRERGPFFIRWEKSNKPVNIGLDVGSYVPLYTATGKIFRAFLPESMTNDLYQQEVAAGNIDPDKYSLDIERVKKQQVAVTESSHISGIASISTPLFYPSRKLAGALSIIGLLGELDVSAESHVKVQLLKTAKDISLRLGYSD